LGARDATSTIIKDGISRIVTTKNLIINYKKSIAEDLKPIVNSIEVNKFSDRDLVISCNLKSNQIN